MLLFPAMHCAVYTASPPANCGGSTGLGCQPLLDLCCGYNTGHNEISENLFDEDYHTDILAAIQHI